MSASTKIDVIREFQGDRTQNEYAEFLGLTSGGLSMILNGKRGANTALIRLLSRYPERSAEITKALLLTESAESEAQAEPVALVGD
jgi:transcriptional regulator with XRE-family HTH domain